MGETGAILVEIPESKDGVYIKQRLKESSEFVNRKFGDLVGRNVFDVALEYIERLEAAQPQWISVADRKPTETGSYIVCTDRNAVCTARYYAQTTFGGTVQNGYFAGKVGNHITHWMNLPEPPKGE